MIAAAVFALQGSPLAGAHGGVSIGIGVPGFFAAPIYAAPPVVYVPPPIYYPAPYGSPMAHHQFARLTITTCTIIITAAVATDAVTRWLSGLDCFVPAFSIRQQPSTSARNRRDLA